MASLFFSPFPARVYERPKCRKEFRAPCNGIVFMTENSNPLVESLTRLAEPLAASLGLALWGVEVLSGGRSVVRIFVESLEGDRGVDIDECAHLSRLLSLSLDVDDNISGAYTLEISSPGLERRFFTAAQLAAAVGRHVEVTLAAPVPAFPQRRKFQGLLCSASLEGGGAVRPCRGRRR